MCMCKNKMSCRLNTSKTVGHRVHCPLEWYIYYNNTVNSRWLKVRGGGGKKNRPSKNIDLLKNLKKVFNIYIYTSWYDLPMGYRFWRISLMLGNCLLIRNLARNNNHNSCRLGFISRGDKPLHIFITKFGGENSRYQKFVRLVFELTRLYFKHIKCALSQNKA